MLNRGAKSLVLFFSSKSFWNVCTATQSGKPLDILILGEKKIRYCIKLDRLQKEIPEAQRVRKHWGGRVCGLTYSKISNLLLLSLKFFPGEEHTCTPKHAHMELMVQKQPLTLGRFFQIVGRDTIFFSRCVFSI